MEISLLGPTCMLSGGIVLCSLFFWYSRKPSNEKINKIGLTYKPTKINNYIIENCKSLSTQFKPAFLFSNGHVQGLLGVFCSSTPIISRREYINLQDGGSLALDWVEEVVDLPLNTPIIIVVPTFTGCVKTSSRFCKQISESRYRCVVFNKRGHGDTILKTPKLQGFGETCDLREAILHIAKAFPAASLVLHGSSAGSALVASYLGDFGKAAIVRAGVAVAAGYDMVDSLTKQLPWIYELILLFHLKKVLKHNYKMLETIINMKNAMSSWTFKDYDYHVYCKFGGQRSSLEYWKENNPMRQVDNIAVPVLCINSLDDPVCVKENIPFDLIAADDNVILLTTAKGGHCGYLEGWNLRSVWSNKVALDYIDVILKYQMQDKSE